MSSKERSMKEKTQEAVQIHFRKRTTQQINKIEKIVTEINELISSCPKVYEKYIHWTTDSRVLLISGKISLENALKEM